MIGRCDATTVADTDALAQAIKIESRVDDPDWAEVDAVQCQVSDDAPHVFHVAFLRDGAQREPSTDVFLHWHQDMPGQWAEDLPVCESEDPTGDICTIYRDHPGACEWAQFNPFDIALRAQVDQLIAALKPVGLRGTFTKWRARLGGDQGGH
ncbi:hypothetical protein ACFXAZ_09135 [Streptomyces sp. NPDC059477]|uniref:hypothetical protein n=1 Tax=Streptomyces sp. NPDC059477 TaxID=3346847 RepID=UPI00369BD124